MMKFVLLTTEGREFSGEYHKTTPWFGTAPQGLIEGFAELSEAGRLEDRRLKFEDGMLSQSSLSHLPSPKFEIHVISCTQQPMQSPEKLAENIWFHSLHVPKWGWLKSGYLGCVVAVRKKLREIHPDLVHAQGTERDCAMSAVFSGYPNVLTIHGNLRLIKQTIGFPPFSALWLQSLLEGFVVPRFNGVVCISNYTKTAVEHEAKKTWVVPNAVDPAFLALGEETESGIQNSESLRHSESSPPIILVVANVDSRKNQNAFIKALDALAKETPFLVKFFGRCGDDDYGKEFERLISERSWCHYGGMISRDELQAEFKSAAVLALPTHEDNCPMVVLEAQAAGVPVMASNVGGIPDLVEDGVTGLLTDPNLPGSMYAALGRILLDTKLAEHLAKNGLIQARTRFAPSVIASAHLDIYSEVIAVHR